MTVLRQTNRIRVVESYQLPPPTPSAIAHFFAIFSSCFCPWQADTLRFVVVVAVVPQILAVAVLLMLEKGDDEGGLSRAHLLRVEGAMQPLPTSSLHSLSLERRSPSLGQRRRHRRRFGGRPTAGRIPVCWDAVSTSEWATDGKMRGWRAEAERRYSQAERHLLGTE